MSDFEFDFTEFKEFADHFDDMLNDKNFLLDVANELGNGMLGALKNNTPVGQYDGAVFFVRGGKLMKFEPKEAVKKSGGHLARSWFLSPAIQMGDEILVEATNNVEYGPYVNNGHRTADHSGWVEGQFFVEASMDEVEANLDPILMNRFLNYLRRFGVS